MELQLQADADALAGLSRLKSLVRDGRPRSQPVRTVWHDSPDHALSRQGLIAAECRGRWRLERVVPGADTWLPGQKPPVLREADAPAGLSANTAEGLVPVAAFEARRTVGQYTVADSPVTMAIERGVLRSVAAEQPTAWIAISGPDHAVHTAALLVAETAAVRVPSASLAAQALALATSAPAAPRHLGAPVLPMAADRTHGITVAQALAHILGHLTDVILHYAPVVSAKAADDGPRIEAVHQMRVAVRRALSAVSVFAAVLPDHTLDPLRQGLKTLAGQLGQTRDWDVFVTETAPAIAAALPPDERLDRLIVAAARRRDTCRKALADDLAGPAFRCLCVDLAWFAAAGFWHAGTEDGTGKDAVLLTDFAATVLQRRWKKLVSAGKRIETLDVPALHALRLRAKRARYAAEMFAGRHDSSERGSKAEQRFIRRLSGLQQRLGQLNDGAVAAHLMDALGGPAGRHGYAVGLVAGFTAARAEKIRPRIVRVFQKFRALPPYWG
jgi:CHAD domain-containing protein